LPSVVLITTVFSFTSTPKEGRGFLPQTEKSETKGKKKFLSST